MTLIASTINHKMPFLISDLLWSSDQVENPTKLPTGHLDNQIYQTLNQQYKPAKLGQKMYFIKDNTCIVFAGLSQEIFIFLTVFRDTFKDVVELGAKQIHDFLQSYEIDRHFSDSAFFIINVEHVTRHAVTVNQFYCPRGTHTVEITNFVVQDGCWNTMDDAIFDTVSACGTGAEGFLNLIRQQVHFQSRYESGNFMRAIQTNAMLICRLLTIERVSLYTIKENWGAGFEAAYYNGERFEKLCDIAYIVNHSQFDEFGDIGLPIPMLVMYYKYIGDILYIVSIEVFKYTIQDAGRHTHFTSPVGEYAVTVFEIDGIDTNDINLYEFPEDFSFNTDKIAMAYSLITPANKIFNPATFNLGPEIQVKYKQKVSLEILIDTKIINDIRAACKQAYPNI